MPVVIPIIAVFATGAVGAVIAGTATFAAYAAVAGAVLSTVGALTDNKTLGKVGMVLSLGAGVANLASAAGSAASSGAEAATSGMDLAADGAASAGNTVADAASAVDSASNAAQIGGAAGDIAGGTGAVDAATGGTTNAVGGGYDFGSGTGASSLADPAAGLTTTMPIDPGVAATGLTNSGGPSSWMDAASQSATTTQQPNLASQYQADLGNSTASQAANPGQVASATPDALSKASQGLTSQDMQAYLAKAKTALSDASDWAEKHGTVLKLGGGLLQGAYGPQAQRLDLDKQQAAQQQSLMDRARANLNQPVKINWNKGI